MYEGNVERRTAAACRETLSAWRLRACAWTALAALASTLALLAASPPSASAGAGCPGAQAKPYQLNRTEARKAIRCLINHRRGKFGRRRLESDSRLQRAAQRHTSYMDSHNCFAHQCPGEASLPSRLRRSGYITGGLDSYGYAENIAWGMGSAGSPREMVEDWMGSQGHRAVILDKRWRHFGVGYVGNAPSSSSGGTYTVDFGFRNG